MPTQQMPRAGAPWGLAAFGTLALVSSAALAWVAWTGADASVAATRAAVADQARAAADAAARGVVAALESKARAVFDDLLTAAPDSLPRVWRALPTRPAAVEALVLIDERGQVAYPPPVRAAGLPWVDERDADDVARAALREGHDAEFRRQDPQAAAAAYQSALDARFGRTVRIEALSSLGFVKLRAGDLAAAESTFQQLADPVRFPPRFVAPELRCQARLGRVQALAGLGRAADAAAEAVGLATTLLAEDSGLPMGALRLFRGELIAWALGAKGGGTGSADLLVAVGQLQQQEAEQSRSAAADVTAWLVPALRETARHGGEKVVAWVTGGSVGATAERIACMTMIRSVRGPFAAGFVWTSAAWQDEIAGAMPATPTGRLRLTACDLGGRALLPTDAPAGPAAEPLALAPLPGLSGWAVRADVREPEAFERSLRWQRGTATGLALSFLVVTAGGLAALVRAARREMELAALRSEFIAQVSHDLKTPVAVIRMFAETLALGRAGTDEKRRECLTIIERESLRLSGMIDNLLDFSRVERGRREYRSEPFDGDALVREWAAAAQDRWTREGFCVDVQVEPLPTVVGDRAALASALQNLVDNAAKYSEDDKWLGLRARARDGRIEIVVSDHGIGIPAAERDRVFEPYYRVADDRVAQRKGSGLGLALVRHVIAAHGGVVQVEPNAPRGTSIRIDLPASGGQ